MMEGDWVVWVLWGVLVIIFILGTIKMFLEFPGLLELKLIYGVEAKDGIRDDFMETEKLLLQPRV